MASSESDTSDILMAGSLCKRTKFTRKWKKFYWRLLSNGRLRRYKDLKQTKSLGEVDIKRNCYDIREGLDITSKVTFPSYIPSSCCFSISFTDKSYFMYAETPASAKEWIKVLSDTSSVISRRRSETDARSRELERRRIALQNARQKRSRRNLPDTMSVDLVLECAEAGALDHLEGIEDQYVTILPPSPLHFNSQHVNHNSTASLLRRSASVPDILNSNENNNSTVTDDVTADSMTSLYEGEAEIRIAPSRMPPPQPYRNQFEGMKRRNSFSEDHPRLQHNTVVQEIRKTQKGYFASPQVTSSTFQVKAVDEMQLNTRQFVEETPLHTINTGASPTQSESSVGIVNPPQQSNITSPISPLSRYGITGSSYNRSPSIEPYLTNSPGSVPAKFTSKQMKTHRKSLPEYVPYNTCVYPTPPHKPVFSFSTSGNSSPINQQITSDCSGAHPHSLPDIMAFPTANPQASPAADREDGFLPPVVKRFTKTHQRRKSLSDLMPTASVNCPDSQRKLHKALGGSRPQSMAAQQAIIAELQIASKLT